MTDFKALIDKANGLLFDAEQGCNSAWWKENTAPVLGELIVALKEAVAKAEVAEAGLADMTLQRNRAEDRLSAWTGLPCPFCKGSGEDNEAHACKKCGGTGEEYMTWEARAQRSEAERDRLRELVRGVVRQLEKKRVHDDADEMIADAEFWAIWRAAALALKLE